MIPTLTDTKQSTLNNLISTAIDKYGDNVRLLRYGMEDTLSKEERERLARQFELQIQEAKTLLAEIAVIDTTPLHVPQRSKNIFEHAIIRALLRTLAALEWFPTEFDDGSEVKSVTDQVTVLDTVFAVDDGILYFENSEHRVGVRLALGEGEGIISEWASGAPADFNDALRRVGEAVEHGPYTIHVSTLRR